MLLEDRTCVVTGASRGIGRGIARELADEGANVVVNYRSSSELASEVVDELEETPGNAIAVQADVTEMDDVQRMASQVHDSFGPVDVLVNNAGVTSDSTFRNMSQEAWHRVIDVNLNGVFRCTKTFFEDVKESEQGRLINISSIIGKQGNFGQANYAAAKSGLFGFTRTMAIELARSGSTANCIAPGFTDTDMLQNVDEGIRDRIRSDIPLGRFGTPHDVACLVRFLASENGGYITGEVIDVNGGKDL